MSNCEKMRDRKYVAVLYPDDPTHVECMERLKTRGFNFAACLHDSDIYETGEHAGELKKPHWHVVLRFKNAVWNTSIADQLGIKPNYIEACDNFDRALEYLIHFGWPDKHQYDIDSVFGPLKARVVTLVSDTDESTRVLNLVDIIENSPGPIGYTELIKKAVNAGLYGDLRRMGTFAVGLIREHNYEYYRSTQTNSGATKDRERFDDFVALTGDKDIKWVDHF